MRMTFPARDLVTQPLGRGETIEGEEKGKRMGFDPRLGFTCLPKFFFALGVERQKRVQMLRVIPEWGERRRGFRVGGLGWMRRGGAFGLSGAEETSIELEELPRWDQNWTEWQQGWLMPEMTMLMILWKCSGIDQSSDARSKEVSCFPSICRAS